MSKIYMQTKNVLVTVRLTVLADFNDTQIQNVVSEIFEGRAKCDVVRIENDEPDLETLAHFTTHGW